MNEFERMGQLEINRALNQILEADLSEIEKLKHSFFTITGRVIEQGQAEIELLRALGDTESLVKGQIKVSTIKYAQSIFDYCYQQTVERKASHDEK
jgi:hypothetical protein